MLLPLVRGDCRLGTGIDERCLDRGVDGPFDAADFAVVLDRELAVAAVFDDSNDQMRLYLDGQLEGSAVFTGALSSLTDNNNWLGRSQFNVLASCRASASRSSSWPPANK